MTQTRSKGAGVNAGRFNSLDGSMTVVTLMTVEFPGFSTTSPGIRFLMSWRLVSRFFKVDPVREGSEARAVRQGGSPRTPAKVRPPKLVNQKQACRKESRQGKNNSVPNGLRRSVLS
jgi:hypothetical protein